MAKIKKMVVKMYPDGRIGMTGHNGVTVGDAATMGAALIDGAIDMCESISAEELYEIKCVLQDEIKRIDARFTTLAEKAKKEWFNGH